MKCPYCGEINNKVIDSRLSKDGRTIRRRRECIECSRRFTTYEKLEDVLPMVVKKDGRREPFNREKIITGIRKACQGSWEKGDRLLRDRGTSHPEFAGVG